VDSSQVSILKETNKVSLGGLLESEDSSGLEAEIGLEVLGNLTDETLEGQLADQELSGLLVFTDLTESDGTGPVSVRLLDSSSSGSGLASSLQTRKRMNETKVRMHSHTIRNRPYNTIIEIYRYEIEPEQHK
jgi:hypothetical protein